MLPMLIAALGEASAAGGAAEAAGGSGGIIESILGKGAADKVGKAGKAFSDITQQAGELLAPFGKLEDSFGKLLKGIVALPAKILEAEEYITGTAKMYVDAAAAPIDTVDKLGHTIDRFVKLADPASFTRFNYAMDNTKATLGNSLVPLMDALTRTAEKTGDAYGKLKPAIDPAIDAIGKVVDVLSDQIEPAAKLAAPLLALAAQQMQLLAFETKVFVGSQVMLLDFYKSVNDRLPKWMQSPWLSGAGFNPAGHGDTAVKPVEFKSIADIQREMMKNSLMAGSDKSVAQKHLDAATGTQKAVEGLLELAKSGALGVPAAVAANLAEAASRLGRGTAQGEGAGAGAARAITGGGGAPRYPAPQSHPGVAGWVYDEVRKHLPW